MSARPDGDDAARSPVAAGEAAGPRLTVLGSGTVVPDHHHLPSAVLLEAPGVAALIDCGAGTLSAMSRFAVDWQHLTHIVLTHFHDDHVGGLPGLFAAWKYGMEPPRAAPVEVLGPRGTGNLLQDMGALEPHLAGRSGFHTGVTEMAPGVAYPLGGLELTCHPTPHTPESLALRVASPVRPNVRTGDTGPSDAVAAFLAGCDVVVAECSWRDPLPVDIHLSPLTLAAMARIMAPDLLVVTHVYPTHMTPDEAVRGVREAGWGGRTVAAFDGMALPA